MDHFRETYLKFVRANNTTVSQSSLSTKVRDDLGMSRIIGKYSLSLAIAVMCAQHTGTKCNAYNSPATFILQTEKV